MPAERVVAAATLPAVQGAGDRAAEEPPRRTGSSYHVAHPAGDGSGTCSAASVAATVASVGPKALDWVTTLMLVDNQAKSSSNRTPFSASGSRTAESC